MNVIFKATILLSLCPPPLGTLGPVAMADTSNTQSAALLEEEHLEPWAVFARKVR